MGSGSSKTKLSEAEKYNLDQDDETINPKSYPMSDVGHSFTLKDERKLGYMIYGKLSNYKATILFFPGSPGTRLFNFDAHDRINKAYGVRMIIVDRPGVGLSSHQKDYTFKSHASDVNELVQHLDIQTYHVIGYSAGGPSACCYAAMYSKQHQMRSLTLISSVGPPDTPNAYGQMTFLSKIGWFIVCNANKTLIDFAANIDSKSSAGKLITKTVEDFGRCCGYDEQMILNPNVLKTFLQSKFEAQSVEITEDKSENRLLFLYGTPWGIRFEDIHCPLFVYNGVDDTSCVPNMASFIFESTVSHRKKLRRSLMQKG